MVDKVIVRDVPYPVERFVEKDVVREVQKVEHAFLPDRPHQGTCAHMHTWLTLSLQHDGRGASRK